MSDSTISILPAASVASGANELEINEAGTSKKVSLTQVVTLLQTLGMPRVSLLSSQHAVTGVTGTKVTGLDRVLEAGTYTFKYTLLTQTTATGTAIAVGYNFTGIALVRKAFLYNCASIATAANGIVEDEFLTTTGACFNVFTTSVFSTTTPNVVHVSFVTQNVNNLMILDGTIVVTVQGTLELWHGSETAGISTSIEANSSLVVVRVG